MGHVSWLASVGCSSLRPSSGTWPATSPPVSFHQQPEIFEQAQCYVVDEWSCEKVVILILELVKTTTPGYCVTVECVISKTTSLYSLAMCSALAS